MFEPVGEPNTNDGTDGKSLLCVGTVTADRGMGLGTKPLLR